MKISRCTSCSILYTSLQQVFSEAVRRSLYNLLGPHTADTSLLVLFTIIIIRVTNRATNIKRQRITHYVRGALYIGRDERRYIKDSAVKGLVEPTTSRNIAFGTIVGGKWAFGRRSAGRWARFTEHLHLVPYIMGLGTNTFRFDRSIFNDLVKI